MRQAPWTSTTVMLMAVVVMSCRAAPTGRSQGLPPGPEGTRAWRAARERLEALREAVVPSQPYVMHVSLDVEKRAGGVAKRTLRGQVAVSPPHAFRARLFEVNGTLALDVSRCVDRWSVARAATERAGNTVSKMTSELSAAASLLLWWFTDPFSGHLLALKDDGARVVETLLLKDGNELRVLKIPLPGGGLHFDGAFLHRRSGSIEASAQFSMTRECDYVHYEDYEPTQRPRGWGDPRVMLTLHCERIETEIPSPRAFAHPSDPTRTCPTLSVMD